MGPTITESATRDTDTAESTTFEVDSHDETATTAGGNYILIFCRKF